MLNALRNNVCILLLSSYDNYAVKVIQQTNQFLMFGYTMLYVGQGRLNVSLKER